MRNLILALCGAFSLGGCGYYPVPPDPIRIMTSPSEVSTCRRLGSVGFARTDGEGPFTYNNITMAVPSFLVDQPTYGQYAPYSAGQEIQGQNFAVRLNFMRDAALALGASDLLLKRRFYQDYSYVEGTAYGCAR